MLKAAILRDQGEHAAAEALYPRIAETWEAVKRRALTPEQREREIAVFIDVAQQRAHRPRRLAKLRRRAAQTAKP
jgi:hypothetical protein